MEKYLEYLVNRLIECMSLSVPTDKLEQVSSLITRHAAELLEQVKVAKEADFIKAKFSNFINKVLSTIEALNLAETQYKAVRKLVLSEIHGCLDMIIVNLGKKEDG
jgi:predicted GTPase